MLENVKYFERSGILGEICKHKNASACNHNHPLHFELKPRFSKGSAGNDTRDGMG